MAHRLSSAAAALRVGQVAGHTVSFGPELVDGGGESAQERASSAATALGVWEVA